MTGTCLELSRTIIGQLRVLNTASYPQARRLFSRSPEGSGARQTFYSYPCTVTYPSSRVLSQHACACITIVNCARRLRIRRSAGGCEASWGVPMLNLKHQCTISQHDWPRGPYLNRRRCRGWALLKRRRPSLAVHRPTLSTPAADSTTQAADRRFLWSSTAVGTVTETYQGVQAWIHTGGMYIARGMRKL